MKLKLPLTPHQARVLRGDMWRLLCLLSFVERAVADLREGGKLTVDHPEEGWTRLYLWVNRQTACAVSRKTLDLKEVLDLWWETFGRMMLGEAKPSQEEGAE